jgi:hypothetical protein
MKMWTSAEVKKHIFGIPDGQTFATRELLGYGHRNAIDALISRLIKAEVIKRVARGIFVKPLYVNGFVQMPTLAQIVITKAKAFGKDILSQHGKDAAVALQIMDSGNGEPTVVASGSSTSFVCESSDFGRVRVHLRSANPLSRKFVNTHIGLFIRAMKSLPHGLRELEVFNKAKESFNRTQRKELKDASKWMPGWLSNMYWIKPPESPKPEWQSDSWDFLRKYLTDQEFSEYMRINVYPGMLHRITTAPS